jgi:hypothetical protein
MGQSFKPGVIVYTAALLMLSVAVSPSLATAGSITTERRTMTSSQDPAVLSLLACFSEAARNIAGSKAPAFADVGCRPVVTRPTIDAGFHGHDQLTPQTLVRLSWLNLPPPVAFC